MLRSVLYYFILLTTGVRLVNMVYLLFSGSINLPVSVMVVSSLMIACGLVVVLQKRTSRLKNIMVFFAVHAVLVMANLITVAIHVPMSIALAETLAVGTVLDIVIDACALYAGLKCLSNEYRPFVRVIKSVE
ncbi:MAG: hypothetical protein FWH02_07355 [Oscillospiraceae bacterium]|nr:hypothetical protein [Oscillospiraceae bacterium]